MAKKEYPLDYLSKFIPLGSAHRVVQLLQQYNVHLTITRERKTILGDYRYAHHSNAAHRISVNGNLNRYAFLITLIHELAHLITFLQFENRVMAHGTEWKNCYKNLLQEILILNVFPNDISSSLQSSLHNLPASSCADENLMRVLRQYDEKQPGWALVEELPEGAVFSIESGKQFKKGKQLRKRFQCVEIDSGRLFLFSPIYEVKLVS
jgi:predicted SprT family Zn-dependent metalloprotease